MEDVLTPIKTKTLQTILPETWCEVLAQQAVDNNRSLSAELRMVIAKHLQSDCVSA